MSRRAPRSAGKGIGFAGVGIKLGLLVSREVVTETQARCDPRGDAMAPGVASSRTVEVDAAAGSDDGSRHGRATGPDQPIVAAARRRLPRGDRPPTLRAAARSRLRRPAATALSSRRRRSKSTDGELARVDTAASERVPIAIRLGRRRTPSASGFIERNPVVPADREGLAISTFGKVIKRGWDWLGLTPSANAPITGLIEAPDLAACLTLSKSDFIRSGARGASYLAYRKAIQEVVSRQLTAWGDRRETEARPRMARLERDLERVLEDLADDFPLLRSLVDRRGGGQKRLPMPGRGDERVPAPLFANVPAGPESTGDGTASPSAEGRTAKPPRSSTSTPGSPLPSPEEIPPGGGQPPAENEALAPEDGEPYPHVAASAGTMNTVTGRRRPARYGLLVQSDSRPADSELARLVDSTIWINDAHPAYTRASASRSLGYHTALAVALALAPLAVDVRDEHAFITQFLAHWGGVRAVNRTAGKRRRT